MKANILIIYLFLNLLNIPGLLAQWQTEKCPVQTDLNGIFFTQNGSGWIVGNKGTILNYVHDVWQPSVSPTQNDLHAVYMTDDNEGWAVGSKGTILHFINGKWDLAESPASASLYAVRFVDSSNGMAVGESGTVLTYRNDRWELQPNQSNGSFLALSGTRNEYWIGGILECANIPIMKMTFNGEQPVAVYNNPGPVQSLAIINEQNGWAVGGKNAMLFFNGDAWEHQNTGFTFPSQRSIYFDDQNHGITAGYEGTSLIYRNGKWSKEVTGTEERLNGVFTRNNCYYAVGDHGTIVSTKKSQEEKLSLAMNVLHVYPNPADSRINVDMLVEEDNSLVTITVNSISGNIIRKTEMRLDAGVHNAFLTTSELENGLYLLTITQNEKSETSKLVIQHN
jgi:photosystem II stability/assembly factor-like uncharacterized protein